MAKIKNDKYYTSAELSKYCVKKTKEIIGEENIEEYIEPSAGNGSFLNYLDKPYLAFDIEPEDDKIAKQDWLTIDLEYKTGRCIIGNPPFGRCLNLAQKFYKKSIHVGDYISFILPISQLNNISSMYEFDLIHSEDLGIKTYTDRKLHCCLNIYKRPKDKLNQKPKNKLQDISIFKQDSIGYKEREYDIRMCYWGDGTAGKILLDDEIYSAEYKIKINNEELKQQIKYFLETFDWKEYLQCVAMRKIQQFHIIDILKKNIEGIK